MSRKYMGIAAAAAALALIATVALNMAGGGSALPPADSGLQKPSLETTEPASETLPPTAVAESGAALQAPARIMVEVQGAVTAPGSYSFPAEARVFDALEKAGGVLEGAEIRDINIAAALVDGSVLSIPFRQGNGRAPLPGAADLNPPAYTRSGWSEAPTASGTAGIGGTQTSAAPAKINLNTATQAELETLPGVGVKTAEKIMRFRETQPFMQVDDLRYVQGIGDKRMETLRPHVTVE